MKKKSLSSIFKLKHAGVLFVALLLIASYTVSSTIRFGEDGSNQLWFGDDNGLIRNSNGKAWTATESNLQSAIWDLNSTGGDVYLPTGSITVTSAILMINNTKLIGSGMNKTVLVAGNALNDDIIRIPGHREHIVISDITLDGNKDQQSNDNAKGIQISNNGDPFEGTGYPNNIIIERVKVYNVYFQGIEVYPSADFVTIQDCYFEGIGHNLSKYVAGITYRGRNGVITGNHILNMTGYGIVLETTTSPARRMSGYTVVDSNVIDGSNLTGIHIEGGASVTNSIISNNIIRNVNGVSGYSSDANGIDAGSSNTVISGNMIENISYKGINIDSGGNELISNVTVTGNVIHTIGKNGVFLCASDCVINDNAISDVDESGILAQTAQASNCIISGNFINYTNTDGGAQDGGIYDFTNAGEDILISNNLIRNTAGQNIRMDNGRIVGNTIIDPVDSGFDDRCIWLGEEIRDNHIINALEYGIQIGSNSIVTGNRIETCAGTGIYSENSNSIQITNNHLYYCTEPSIHMYNIDKVQINDNKIINSSSRGIYLEEGCTEFQINNNQIEDTDSHGMYIHADGSRGLINNNHVFEANARGIIVDGNNITISNNLVHDCNLAGIETLGSNDANNSFIGNIVKDCTVGIDDNGDWNIIMGNNCKGNSGNDIETAGSNNIEEHNLYDEII